jgi:hypothetical protein
MCPDLRKSRAVSLFLFRAFMAGYRVNFTYLSLSLSLSLSLYIYIYTVYTGCPRRKGQYIGRMFLMLNYTDISQNTLSKVERFRR